MTRAWLGVSAALLALLAGVAAGCGSDKITDTDLKSAITQIRDATEKYKDYKVALKDGFTNTKNCVESPDGAKGGAAGIHFINFKRELDNKSDLRAPEELNYEPQADGSLVLVGVEFRRPIIKGQKQAPDVKPLGHLDGPLPPTIKGDFRHWQTHMWVWRNNPDGIFAPWNPKISCGNYKPTIQAPAAFG